MIEIKNLTTVIITITLSILLAFVSFTGGASEAYLFPKIITSTMIILSTLSLLFYFFEKNQKIAKIRLYFFNLIGSKITVTKGIRTN